MQAELDMYQIAIDNDVNIFNQYWKTELLSDISSDKSYVYNYKSMGDAVNATKYEDNINKALQLLKSNDFSGYIKLSKDKLKLSLDSGNIKEQEYNDDISILELKEKYEIGKTYNTDDTWKSTLLDEIKSAKTNLRNNIDETTGKVLTNKEIKKANDTIKINEYRIAHNMQPYVTSTSTIGKTRKVYDYMMSSITMMVLAVMIIIIAGGAISTEVSKGTIKFWSFTPNKRWKILFSKLFVDTAILIVITILITLLSAVVGNIFFGSKDAQAYIYVANGTVKTINYISYTILYNLVGAVDIFMFLLLALMLSTVSRNTAVAVGISIAAYLGGKTIMSILNMFITSDWIKFVPFNNLGLADRIFTNDISYSASQIVSTATGNIAVGFSLAVLGVTALIMIITMFDSFNKRDIGA